MRNILRKNKRKIIEENGAVSTLVLFTVLVFAAILSGSFMIVTSLQKSQLKSDLRIQDIYRKDADEVYDELTKYAKYDKPYIPEGFTHTKGTWNSGYVIKDELGNEFVWVPCVTDQSKVKEGDTVTTFKKILPSTTETTDSYYMYNKNNYTITGEENPASAIRTSVATYGGFYIASYEAGIEGTTENVSLITITATDGSVKPLSQAGKGVWNGITRVDSITVASSMVNTLDGVKSALVSGEAWDTTLQWIVTTSDNAGANEKYDINSEGKGWYSEESSNNRHLTGYYAINNIYDMAGNVFEWTTENCTYNGTSYLVRRGGNSYNSGTVRPAADRYHSNDGEAERIGFRVVLYK